MEWQVIVALVIAIPVILFPAAFVWYLNVSGLYQVVRATRQRERRRSMAMREAEGLVRGKVVAEKGQLSEATGARRIA